MQPRPSSTHKDLISLPAGGLAGAEVPEPEGLVPGAAEGEVAVGGEDDVGDEVAVAVEPLLGDAVVHVVAGQLPDDERLVAGGGEDHLRVLGVGGDLGYPAIVPREGTAELQGLGHGSSEVQHFTN